MATSPPPINQFTGAAPQRGDRSTFSARVDAFVTWLIAAVVQLPALALNVYNNALEAFQSAGTATGAAAAAMAAANASAWVSGMTYAQNVCAISQVNFQAYLRAVAGAGTIDPANDQTNWRLLAGNDSNGAFVPIPMAALNMDLSLGNYFLKSISANSALTFSNFPAGGYSWTLELTTTGTVLITLPTSVRTSNNTGFSLQANKRHKLMFVTSNGGTRVDLVTAPNFDI